MPGVGCTCTGSRCPASSNFTQHTGVAGLSRRHGRASPRGSSPRTAILQQRAVGEPRRDRGFGSPETRRYGWAPIHSFVVSAHRHGRQGRAQRGQCPAHRRTNAAPTFRRQELCGCAVTPSRRLPVLLAASRGDWPVRDSTPNSRLCQPVSENLAHPVLTSVTYTGR